MRISCPLCQKTINVTPEIPSVCSSCKQVVLVTKEDTDKYVKDGLLTQAAKHCYEKASGNKVSDDALDFDTDFIDNLVCYVFINTKQMITAGTAARLLNVTADWVKHLSSAGFFPGTMTGNKQVLYSLFDVIAYRNEEIESEDPGMTAPDCRSAIDAVITASIFHSRAFDGITLNGMQVPDLILDEFIIDRFGAENLYGEKQSYHIPKVPCPIRTHIYNEDRILYTLYGDSIQELPIIIGLLFDASELDHLDIWVLGDTKVLEHKLLLRDEWDEVENSLDDFLEHLSSLRIAPKDESFPDRVARYLENSGNRRLLDMFNKAEYCTVDNAVGTIVHLTGENDFASEFVHQAGDAGELAIPKVLIPHRSVFLFSEASNMGYAGSTHTRYGCLLSVVNTSEEPDEKKLRSYKTWSAVLFIETVTGEITLHPSILFLHFLKDRLDKVKFQKHGTSREYKDADSTLIENIYYLFLSSLNIMVSSRNKLLKKGNLWISEPAEDDEP